MPRPWKLGYRQGHWKCRERIWLPIDVL